MSETIIIESNRQIAYKQEKAALINSDQSLSNVVLPNNKWVTRLENGIPVSVGDQIQIEAVMVNTRGSPEETIEFSGIDVVENDDDVIDNKAVIRFQNYITNRQQFNCNLPLNNASIQFINARGGNYGYLSFSLFRDFSRNFPFRGIEGMYSEGTPPVFTEVENGGVFTRPPAPVYDADPTRYYLGSDDFVGYANLLNSEDRGAWSFKTHDVELEVDIGFNTPSKIGETLTAQLHQRQGLPTKWDEQTVPASIVNITGALDAGTFVVSPNAGITDNSYRTVPTATGDVFRARAEGKWHAIIAGEAPEEEEGNNYQEEEGRDLFHRNLACGNPNEYRNVYGWLVPRVKAHSAVTIANVELNTVGLYTGAVDINAYDVGEFGLNPVLLDQMEFHTKTENFTYFDFAANANNDITETRNSTSTLASMDYLQISQPNTLWTTNIVYNDQNLNDLTISWRENDIPTVSGDTPMTINKLKAFYQQLYYGRADDNKSCGVVGNKINLPNTPNFLTTPTAPALLNSYQSIPKTTGKKVLVRRAGESAWNSRNHVSFWSFYDDSFQPTNDLLTLHFPANSLFTLYDSNGLTYPQTASKTHNLAIVPVFYRQDALPSPNMKDIPLCAFVSIDRIEPAAAGETRLLPAPMLGEFFGRSPSCYDNLLAKVVSTQKTYRIIDNSGATPITTYPPGTDEVNTRTYCYMPYCMVGADNPTIQFDDTYGRFTVSGLHTAVRAGNGVFQDIPPDANQQGDVESMCAYSKEAAICTLDETGNPIQYAAIVQSVVNNPIISAQSGVAIQDIFLYTKSGQVNYDSALNPQIPLQYDGCIFDKLGFKLEQLIPYIGLRQSNFNRGTYNQYLGTDASFKEKYESMVKPFTTDAYISAAAQLSMVKNDALMEMGNLGGNAPGVPVFINAESDSLVAINLPSKLDYSYLVVYSNIVPSTQFYGGGNGQQLIPAMGYVSRNYSTGDYFFGTETSWSYTVDKDYIITEFDTNITLPNGLPAPIENNSSIIYKITKAKSLPPPLSSFQPPKKK